MTLYNKRMHHVLREALVPYTPQQMYALVNDVANYSHFLSWCKSSRIVAQKDHELTATLVIAKAGLYKAFTTKNTLTPFERIDIDLVNGPFKHLTGHWKFTENPQGCLVSVNLEFEFSSKILEIMFGPVFHEVAHGLVHAFTQEAHRRYGN